MKIKIKKVYYCDYCKKHSLNPITKHELSCTANPKRKCRMPGCEMTDERFAELLNKYKSIDISIPSNQFFRDSGYCPACALAIARQCNVITDFDYQKELKIYWNIVND